MKERVISGNPSLSCNDDWLARKASLTTRNERFQDLGDEIESMMPGTLQQFLSTDLVGEAEVKNATILSDF